MDIRLRKRDEHSVGCLNRKRGPFAIKVIEIIQGKPSWQSATPHESVFFVLNLPFSLRNLLLQLFLEVYEEIISFLCCHHEVYWHHGIHRIASPHGARHSFSQFISFIDQVPGSVAEINQLPEAVIIHLL